MMRCGWCQNSGFIGDKRCVCAKPTKRYFPNRGKKKTDDMLKSGHKHTMDRFVSETKSGMWFECDCGHTFKVTA